MKEFSYHEPATAKEAISLLKEFKSEAKIKAGGTDLFIKMKKEMISPGHLINLKNIGELAYIDYIPKIGLRIGALTTLSQIENSTIIRDKFNILWQAASKVASPQIRNRATLGGNICLDSRCHYYNQSRQWLLSLNPCYKRRGNCCHVLQRDGKCYSIFCADTVPALISLMAKVKLVNSEGERVLLLEDFYTGVGIKVNSIRRDEILTEIQIPEINEIASGVYLKISERGEVDFPIVGIALLVHLDRDETFDKVDLVIIGTGPSPIRLSEIEEVLKGEKFDSKIVNAACEKIPDGVRSISNVFKLGKYKERILPSLVAHGIMRAGAAFLKGTAQ